MKKLEDAGIKLVTISYDTEEVLQRFTKTFDISFTMLSDVGSVIIKRFDLLNSVPEWGLEEGLDDPHLKKSFNTFVSITRPNELFIGIAFPGTFILDTKGVVKERHFEDAYVYRNTISSVLLHLGEDIEPVSAMRMSTAQFNLTSYSSNPEIAVGNRFSLVIDIEPLEGIHIYAPGAKKYKAITLTLNPHPYIRLLPMTYPASEDYYFAPFDETIPVYMKPVKLLQKVILDATPQTQQALRDQDSITLTGVLEYQACDEKLCYPPASIALSWTMALRDLVRRLP